MRLLPSRMNLNKSQKKDLLVVVCSIAELTIVAFFVGVITAVCFMPNPCHAWEKDPGGTLDNGLVSYWPLNEKTGIRIDAKGANHLSTEGAPGWVTSTVGNLGRAADFDGTDDCLKISDASQTGLDFAYHDFSYQLWWSYDVDQSSTFLMARDKLGSRAMAVYTQTPYITVNMAVNDVFTVGATMADTNTWYHVVWTFDYVGVGTSVMRVYVNGVLAGTDTNNNGMIDSTGDFQLAAREYTTSRGFYNGKMMHVAAWSRVLDADEVALLYNEGEGNSYLYSTPATPSGKCKIMPTSTIIAIEQTIPSFIAAAVFCVMVVAGLLWGYHRNSMNREK